MIDKTKVLMWLPAIFMMVIIFQFSTANGKQSAGLSLKLTEQLVDVIIDTANLELSQEEKIDMLEVIHTPIRKLGHMAEYGMLALTLAFPLYFCHHKRGRKLVIWCEGIGILYACTDEIHQLIVPERSGQLTDVLIDSIGLTLGLIFFLLVLQVINRFLRKRT
jgi:VanZ family protein